MICKFKNKQGVRCKFDGYKVFDNKCVQHYGLTLEKDSYKKKRERKEERNAA